MLDKGPPQDRCAPAEGPDKVPGAGQKTGKEGCLTHTGPDGGEGRINSAILIHHADDGCPATFPSYRGNDQNPSPAPLFKAEKGNSMTVHR